jgi:hypothetical protein
MNPNFLESIKNNTAAVVLASGLVIAAALMGGVYALTRDSGDRLTVTGSARMSVTSDRVVWRTSFSRSTLAVNLKDGYTSMSKDLSIVKRFMIEQGIPETQMIIAPVMVTEEWSQNSNDPKRYTLRQNIEVTSNDITKITDIAKMIDRVVGEGVFFQNDAVEYYYTPLDEARVKLLTDAVTDARARAQSMAASGKQTVGKLVSASSGVVQVLSRDSVEISDYGSYDTSKPDKDIMVTVRATFKVR